MHVPKRFRLHCLSYGRKKVKIEVLSYGNKFDSNRSNFNPKAILFNEMRLTMRYHRRYLICIINYVTFKSKYYMFILPSSIHIRLFTILCAGARATCLIEYSQRLPLRAPQPKPTPCSSTQALSRRTAPARANMKRGCSRPHRADQRKPELQTAHGLLCEG